MSVRGNDPLDPPTPSSASRTRVAHARASLRSGGWAPPEAARRRAAGNGNGCRELDRDRDRLRGRERERADHAARSARRARSPIQRARTTPRAVLGVRQGAWHVCPGERPPGPPDTFVGFDYTRRVRTSVAPVRGFGTPGPPRGAWPHSPCLAHEGITLARTGDETGPGPTLSRCVRTARDRLWSRANACKAFERRGRTFTDPPRANDPARCARGQAGSVATRRRARAPERRHAHCRPASAGRSRAPAFVTFVDPSCLRVFPRGASQRLSNRAGYPSIT